MDKKKTAAVVGVTGGVSYLVYKKISDDLFKSTFLRKDKEDTVEQKYLDWLSQSNIDQIKVDSIDGLKLNGYDIHNHDNDKYIIMVHGLWSGKAFMYPRAYEFDQLGYNILLIDQRSAGESEGVYYTYGQKESLDIPVWIDYLNTKYKDIKICLFGLSMGAVTVMMASANSLPENVKCIVEDCGFSSLKEELDHVLKKNYKLSFTAPILLMIEQRMKKEFGTTFKDCSPKKCLESNEIPILFIHGEADDFVPFKMAKALYNHNKGSKKFYPVPEANHTEATIDPNYFVNINDFISTHFN